MARVEIYTTPLCPYCWRAKSLLEKKGVTFTEIDLSIEPRRREEMLARADGRRTVPQIFIDDRGIGGCDDLFGLERTGSLEPLLTGQGTGDGEAARA